MDKWPSKFSESFGLDRHWSIECSSLIKGGSFEIVHSLGIAEICRV